MDIRNQILENIKVRMDEEQFPATIADGVLSVLFEDFSDEPMEIYADFFFADSMLGEDTALFHSVFNLAEGASEEELALLNQCANVLNYYVEAGSFSADINNGTFSYRNSVLIDTSLDEEIISDQVYLNAALAIAVAGKYVDLFVKVAAGLMDIEEVKGLIAGE